MELPNAIFVVHETIIDIDTLEDYLNDPEFLGSYHAVISITGEINYFTPSDMKAFAASDSKFLNDFTGEEESVNGSVDDFAYHCALETPLNGRDPNKLIHSGYSIQQYKSLAWLFRATGISSARFAFHGELKDPITTEPRCFNEDYFSKMIMHHTNEPSINLGILKI